MHPAGAHLSSANPTAAVPACKAESAPMAAPAVMQWRSASAVSVASGPVASASVGHGLPGVVNLVLVHLIQFESRQSF